jgi:RND family efflux transporter MFP subunit
MTLTRPLILALTILLTLAGCRDRSGRGGRKPAHAEEGLSAIPVTVWTARSELFMEYEPLILGQTSRFAAHLTHLEGFKAATDGTLTVTLGLADGSTATARAEAPASTGIFRVTITPRLAGRCTLAVVYERAGVKDVLAAGDCVVQPDLPAARKAAAAVPEREGIAYTKEQQWKTRFATATADLRPIRPSVSATGELRPAAGREARITAPSAGRLTLVPPAAVIGQTVRKGQWLATVYPRLPVSGDRASLDAAVATARAEVQAADLQLARAERLLREQAAPERAVEEARTRQRLARARLEAATGRLSQWSAGSTGRAGPSGGALQVRSPLDGTLVLASAIAGENVEEGQLLYSVIDLTRIWVVARVRELDLARLEPRLTAWFTLTGQEGALEIEKLGGRLVTVGQVIDPLSRTAPVIFEIENPGGRLRIGQFAQVFLGMGAPADRLVVPISALIDDAGQTVVYVQTSGETFERRVVRTGVRAAGWVEVSEGVARHEHVVTRGAYEIKLAAASGSIPKHGHVH